VGLATRGRPCARAGGVGFSSRRLEVGDPTGFDTILAPLILARALGDSCVVVTEEADDEVSWWPSSGNEEVAIFSRPLVLISFLVTACIACVVCDLPNESPRLGKAVVIADGKALVGSTEPTSRVL